MSKLSDIQAQEIFKKVKQGNHLAFRRLFDAYYKYLVVTAFQYLNDDGKAKDLAQDVFAELWNKKDSINITYGLKSYLRKAIVNKSLNFLKREKRIDFSDNESLPEAPDQAIAPKILEAEETNQLIQKAINALPDRCRVIFCMSRFDEKSHKEIASELGISTKTIENQITIALRSIRRALAHYNIVRGIIIFIYCLFL